MINLLSILMQSIKLGVKIILILKVHGVQALTKQANIYKYLPLKHSSGKESKSKEIN